jgi:hypothetical protein
VKPTPKVVIFAAVMGLFWLTYWVSVGQHSTCIDNGVEEELALSGQLLETSVFAVVFGGALDLRVVAGRTPRR